MIPSSLSAMESGRFTFYLSIHLLDYREDDSSTPGTFFI
jgi:hypothetical protein